MAWALGRYLVLETLGEGATGQIYAAYDPQLDRRVAIKLLKPVPGVDPSLLQSRLLREAQAMARLSHQNVVSVHDVGTAEGQVFVAMELVEGTTLRSWLEERPRPWREVLATFVQAGEGLAAAHAGGLVHRDFKPANVVLGRDGVVKVTDFGLAVSASDFATPRAAPAPEVPAEDLAPDRSTSAMLVGTPAYMSPEQRQGRPVDARSDQYSFCVALFEGLTGHRPAGSVPAPGAAPGHPAPRSIPGWVMRPVLRGLKESPGERHPSMRALLDALAADPARRRTRLLGTSALAALVVAVLGTAYVWAEHRRLLCSGASAQLSGAWDGSTRESVTRAFLGSSVPYAKDVLAGVVKSLDGRAEAWTSMNVEACEATRLRGTQSEALLDRRMACLGRKLEEMRALTALLAKADAKVVERAGQAVEALPAISECSSALALVPATEAPLPAEVRPRAEALERGLAEAAALRETGQLKQALERSRALVDDAATLGSPRLEALARAQLARVDADRGEFADAERAWPEAIAAAEACQDDVLRAEAWTALTRVVGAEQARFRDAQQMAAQANAVVQRLGRPARLEAEYQFALGSVHLREGRQKEAIAELQRAVDQSRAAFAPDDTRIATVLTVLGVALRNSGQLAEARSQLQAALGIVERKLGPMHPVVANTLYQLSSVHRRLGDFDLAWDTALRALAAREAVFGPRGIPVGRSLNGLGILLQEQARYRDAEPYLRRALAVFQATLGPDHPDTAAVMNNLANALMNWDPAEAQRLRRRALAVQQKSLGSEHPEVANTESNLAATEFTLAHYAEALAEVSRAIAIREKQPGAATGELANDWDLHGELLEAMGRPAEGLSDHQRALAIRDLVYGPASAFHGVSLTRMASAYLALQQPGKALGLARQALALEEGGSIDPTELALARFVLARALAASHEEGDRALTLAREARQQLAAHQVEQSPYLRQMDAWLASHDRGSGQRHSAAGKLATDGAR